MELNGELYHTIRYNLTEGCNLCSIPKYAYMFDREKYGHIMASDSRHKLYHIPCFYHLYRQEKAYEDIRYLFANPNFVPKLFTLVTSKLERDVIEELYARFRLPDTNLPDDLYEFL